MNKIQIYIPKFYKFLNKSVSWCKDNGKRSVKRCPVSEVDGERKRNRNRKV